MSTQGLRDRAQQAGEKQKDEREVLRKVLDRLTDTEDGIRFMQYLRFLCGDGCDTIPVDANGDLAPNKVLALMAKKTIYENIRNSLTVDKKLRIEKNPWEFSKEESK